jgi:hypothetical protein
MSPLTTSQNFQVPCALRAREPNIESEKPDVELEVLTPNTHLKRAEGGIRDIPEVNEAEPLTVPEGPEGAGPGKPVVPGGPAVPIGNAQAIGRTHPMVLRGARVTGDSWGCPKGKDSIVAQGNKTD